MPKHSFILLLVGFVVLGMLASYAESGDTDVLSSLPGWNKLTESQKQVVQSVINKYNCYYECSDTIAQCLKEQPVSKAAKRLAAFVIRRALAGKMSGEIIKDLLKRERSAFPPRTYQIDTSGLVPVGDPNAPVVVVIYADFQCPYCRVASPALKRLATEMPHKMALYFKNFPVKSHKAGLLCAKALVAAGNQGKFWQMHDAMFAAAPNLDKEVIDKIAKRLNLDLKKFASDMESSSTLARIRKEKLEGIDMGMKGTPGIFINGKYYAGIKTYEELKDRILEELDILSNKE